MKYAKQYPQRLYMIYRYTQYCDMKRLEIIPQYTTVHCLLVSSGLVTVLAHDSLLQQSPTLSSRLQRLTTSADRLRTETDRLYSIRSTLLVTPAVSNSSQHHISSGDN